MWQLALEIKDYILFLESKQELSLTLSFLKGMARKYGKKPEWIITDGGIWYNYALRRLGINHKIVSGNIRNYVERQIETLKDRLKVFDNYFPHKESGYVGLLYVRRDNYSHVINWLCAFTFFYNRLRRHMSLCGRTPEQYIREVLCLS